MPDNTRKRRPPAKTPEGRENQLIDLAIDLAEQLILKGEASSQVLTHFLKLGSSKEQLEKARLIEENKLLKAKTEALQSTAKVEALYKEALNAMKTYSGNTTDDYD